MLSFTAAAFILVITPGPGVLSAAGVGSSFGYRAGTTYVAGLILGTNIVAAIVASGVAAVVLAMPMLREVLLAASAIYLTYLATRIAFAGANLALPVNTEAPGIFGGIVLQLINPKAYVALTALFTGFAVWPANLHGEVIVKLIIINTIWLPVHLLWLGAGAGLRKLALKPGAQRAISYAMATTLMAFVALAVLFGLPEQS